MFDLESLKYQRTRLLCAASRFTTFTKFTGGDLIRCNPQNDMTMNYRIWIASRMARRISRRTRLERRALCDYQRQESKRIKSAERRTRGLRLFVAWSRGTEPHLVRATTSDWLQPVPRVA